MILNDRTMAEIENHEGFSATWYPDAGYGWSRATVAFGHTDAAGAPYYKDNKTKKYTKAEGREILRNDLEKYAKTVREKVKVPLNENQYGALVSFTYNVGQGAFSGSTLLKKLNSGDYKSVSSELMKWTKSNGKTLKGLQNRRKAESILFNTPVDTQKPVDKPEVLPAPSVPNTPKTSTEPSMGFAGLIKLLINLFVRKK